MEPFVAVRGRLQKDGETTNVIAFEVRALRFGGDPRRDTAASTGGADGGVRTPGAHRVQTGIREEELFPALPGTQEWWPDRDRVEKEAGASSSTAGTSSRTESPGLPMKEGSSGNESEDGKRRREVQRQEAQEEALKERRRQPLPNDPSTNPSPELPDVREWWGKPEEARKSPFAYLTALRQAPPGTKSWG
jgi:hypothetical protein